MGAVPSENRGGEDNCLRERSAPRCIPLLPWARAMNSRQIFALEIAGMVLLFVLIARWYWSRGWLRSRFPMR